MVNSWTPAEHIASKGAFNASLIYYCSTIDWTVLPKPAQGFAFDLDEISMLDSFALPAEMDASNLEAPLDGGASHGEPDGVSFEAWTARNAKAWLGTVAAASAVGSKARFDLCSLSTGAH